LFKTGLMPAAPMLASENPVPVPAPAPPRATEPASAKAVATTQSAQPRGAADIIADIQRELSRRGFYDGTIDGRKGRRTEAAIRDFEHAARLKPSTEPNETLLRAIKSASPKTVKPGGRAAAPARNDPIAQLLAPSNRVLAVQRALSDYGYGQIEPTGIVDPATQTALAKFERARKLPVTNEVTDQLARELAVVTGRPLE
jgi:peptidoglycan hydrolase-like protein with peptidoglycan-binding domain